MDKCLDDGTGEFAKFVDNIQVERSKSADIKMYIDDENYLATMFIHNGLFLEYKPIIFRLLRDSLRLYSTIPANNKEIECCDGNFMSGYLNECIVKLVESQPMKSYLRLTFKQVMKFIFRRSKTFHLVDITFVLGFMNELRTSYSTICSSDKQIFRPTSKLVSGFNYNLGEDASFLIYWAVIEAAKYCICHKFAPELSANEFLSLLQKEAVLPVALGDKITRRFLANFLLNLDKFLSDRVLKSSTQRLTFSGSPSIEQFFTANSSVFRTWLFKDRGYIANLSLINDNPAETWRNVFKHFFDLTSKFHGHPSSKIPPSDWMRLTSHDWPLHLNMISVSARQLEDAHLLYGIRKLTNYLGTVCNYNSLESIISNFEGRYHSTYDLLKNREDLDEQNMIEFLDSCIELNLLEANKEHINNLKCKKLQGLYKHYLESKCPAKSSVERFAEVQKWLSSWSDPNEFQESDLAGQPMSKCLDIIIPTCLNLIVRAPTDEKRDMIERSEWLISQDFIAQSLFPPCFINKNIKVFNLLIDLLKGMNEIPDYVVRIHADDLYWNNLLFRHLSELDLIGKLYKPETNNNVDLIQLRAAKYNLRCNNTARFVELAENLLLRTNSEEIESLCTILSVENCPDVREKYNHLLKNSKFTRESKLPSSIKDDLMSKILRRVLKLPLGYKLEDQKLLEIFGKGVVDSGVRSGDTTSNIEDPEYWTNLFPCCSLESKAKTLHLFSKSLNEELNSKPLDSKLLNSAFKLDLKLLALLCQSRIQKHKSYSIDCAARIIKQISVNFANLDDTSLEYLTSDIYMAKTMSVWIVLKNNLISLATCKDDLNDDWRNAIIKILKHIGQTNPYLLIYNTIVNRLDLQNDIFNIRNDSNLDYRDPITFLMPSSCDLSNNSSNQEPRKKQEESQLKLKFWDEILNEIMSSKQLEASWRLIVTETERFLKELRKISFLCGEYFKTITLRIPKRFHHFLDYFSKFCDTKSGKIVQRHRLDECEKRLKTVCDQAINQIKILLCYGKKISKSSSSTKYDVWFCETFNKHLLELEYRINLLSNKKPMILNELEKLIKSITELLVVCRNTLLQYNQNNRQKLYMELISPLLSRLEPSLIPMPDCCNNLTTNLSKPIVTIFKISQTVNLIISKTSPKKLKFTGSDGISRSFLLKAHEDLRLDQLVMDLFASINSLLMGNRAAQNRYKVRMYSVTPVSSRSGLIQWVEAPSLCSSYRTWLNSVKGKEVVEKLYATTCPILCDTQKSSSNHGVPSSSLEHSNCKPPQTLQTFDPFYQILWEETKPTKNPLTDIRPSYFNSLKYRAEFEPVIFQRVVEKLADEIPKELLSNQLWFKSHNSYSYWMKTQRFIHSCATMSIIGYIIGLGDRHPENILLDYNTGEVIHIDYNICFELGKTLTVPEKVPFRLTHDIIHALGFAGLEGGFTHSSRIVLDILKDSRSTLLHLLDPVNLAFMIGSTPKVDETIKDSSRNGGHKKIFDIGQQVMVSRPKNANRTQVGAMDMCSQESIESDPQEEDLTDLLITNNPSWGHQETNCVPNIEIKSLKIQTVSSLGLQHNIKTPTKILASTATQMHERIKDKLSGTDEQLRHQKYRRSEKPILQLTNDILFYTDSATREKKICNIESDDLITLNDAQTTGDQVDALIFEATSFKNKSAMYEGWIPWL